MIANVAASQWCKLQMGNAVTEGRQIVIGLGSSKILSAALYALSGGSAAAAATAAANRSHGIFVFFFFLPPLLHINSLCSAALLGAFQSASPYFLSLPDSCMNSDACVCALFCLLLSSAA